MLPRALLVAVALAAAAPLLACASDRARTRNPDAPPSATSTTTATPATAWDADWLWAGVHADADAAYGFGAVRVDRAPKGRDSALDAARSSAADLVLSVFAPPGDAPKRFSSDEAAGLGTQLAALATVTETFTSTTGRAFAAARLPFADALAVLSRAPAWTPTDERTARAGFADLARSRPASPRVAPDWVSAWATVAGSPPILSGTGLATRINNASLARATADARARFEVAKTWEMLVASAFRDYAQRWGTGEIHDDPPDEADEVPRLGARVWTQQSLTHVHVTARWHDVRHDAYYARAELDLEAFLRTLTETASSPELAKRAAASFRAVFDAARENSRAP